MKKYLFLAAIAAVALAACAKVETYKADDSAPEAVTFGVYTGKAATKAVSATTFGTIDQTALEGSANGFGVFAFHSDNSADANDYVASPSASPNSNFKPNFMYNQKVKYNSGKWEYSPLKYWPNEYGDAAVSTATDKLTFFAYAPYVATVGTEGITAFSENSATGDPTVSFKVPAKAEEQIDLLWSNADLKNKTKYAVNGLVKFTFVHALSNLSIYPIAVVDATSIPASNGTDIDAATKVTINSITIKGKFNQEGTLNIATGVWTSSAAAAAQTVSFDPTTAVDVTAINDKAEADATTNKPVAELMFIPSSAAQDYEIAIDYDFTTTDAAVQGGKVVVNNKISKTLSGLTFEQGHRIKLYLALGITSVKIEATVGNWTDDAAQTVWLPLNL